MRRFLFVSVVLALIAIVPAGIVGASTLTEQAKLVASDGTFGDQAGRAVAVNGDLALVGAPFDDSNTGAVYVFVRSGTTWTEEAKLTASDADTGDAFGIAVDFDGTTAVIGANAGDDDGAGLTDSGAAYVFVRTGGTWSEQAKLNPGDPAVAQLFGADVAVDGDRAVVGADLDAAGGNNSGAAYVFVRSGTSWAQEAKLTASDAAPSDRFGIRVDIDADTALIAAQLGDNDALPVENMGAAYIFVRSGSAWSQQAKLVASSGGLSDMFWTDVALDGDTALVGAAQADPSSLNQAGAAYVYTRSATTWTPEATLTAADAAVDDFFGFSVALEGDRALVGAIFDDDNGTSSSGSVYVFDRTGSTWTQQQKFTASDYSVGAQFGRTASLSGDTAVVGAINDFFGRGAAYAFVPGNEPDSDGDGEPDDTDNCPDDPNPGQENNDGDLLGDVCDPDDDNDGQSDADETACGSDPLDDASLSPDFDGDDVVDCLDADDDNDGVDDADDAFPQSDLSPTVIIDGVETGIANQVLADGSTFNDLIAQAAADAANHGEFVRAVAALTNEWKAAGLITGQEKGSIQSTAAQSSIPS